MQILASEVDFWSEYDYDYMKLMHEERMYPPKTSLIVHSQRNQRAAVTLKVNGMKSRPDFSFTISKQFGSNTIPLPVSTDDNRLKESDFNVLNGTLCNAVAAQWDDFGSYLGVDQSYMDNVKRENDKVYACFREVIKRWLRQIDPPPTKSKILQVLKLLQFNQEADQLEKLSRSRHLGKCR